MIELDLPFAPSTNHLYKPGKNGGKFLDPKVETFRLQVLSAVGKAKAQRAFSKEDRLAVFIECYEPDDKRRRDISNQIKSVEDALVKALVFPDDSAIDWIGIERKGRVENGKLIVKIRSLNR